MSKAFEPDQLYVDVGEVNGDIGYGVSVVMSEELARVLAADMQAAFDFIRTTPGLPPGLMDSACRLTLLAGEIKKAGG